MSSDVLSIGAFVQVGDDVGIVVKLAACDDVPDDHCLVWYGETNEAGAPKCRTVPVEYCVPVTTTETCH